MFWIIREWIITGHPFYTFVYNHAVIPQQLAWIPNHGWLYEMAVFPGVLTLTLTPVALVGTLYGLCYLGDDIVIAQFHSWCRFFSYVNWETIATHGAVALARYPDPGHLVCIARRLWASGTG